ncbi:MAG: LysR family transcriptional regulator [Proteobacteria bacterium]|nr:LysR family transcriptional regulator [Pseudomonadota bacterium]
MLDRFTLRQIRAVIAVAEESSFTRAAAREHATQSGISQHVAAAEKILGVKLFERAATGARATPAGMRFYRRCVEAIAMLAQAGEETRAVATAVAGPLRIGLMPSFTRAALAPALERFVPRYPHVRIHIVEGYSGLLTDMVLGNDLEFAIVPAFEGRMGLRARLLVRDREMLVSGPRRGLLPLEPVRLGDLAPLKIVVPGRQNVRRRNIDIYFQTHGVAIAERIELDAMIGTLEFVARTDWVAILPGLICVNDIDGGALIVSPIADPPLHAEFVVITQVRRPLSQPARLFLDIFEAEIAAIKRRWAAAIALHKSMRRRAAAPPRPRTGSPIRPAARRRPRPRS